MKRIIWVLLIFVTFTFCKTVYVAETELEYERVAELVTTGDPEIEKMIAPYKRDLSAVMDEVIGDLDVMLVKERPESNIGNWLADMLFEETRSLNGGVLDFAVQNYGGVRINSMAPGPISIGEIFEVMPFDNMISIITASGKGTREFLDHIARDRGWPVSKSIRFKIKESRATEIMIHGQPLEDDKIYHFAVPDYIAGGGSGSNMLKNFDRKDLDVLIRDSFINNIKKDTAAGASQTASKDGRIINLDHE